MFSGVRHAAGPSGAANGFPPRAPSSTVDDTEPPIEDEVAEILAPIRENGQAQESHA